jgi:hypothetical protein
METKPGHLVATLTDAGQSTFAGQDSGRAIRMARDLLVFPVPVRPSVSHSVAAELRELVDRVEAAVWERNEIVHNVWPEASLEGARGWRYAPKSRNNSDDATVWSETTGVGLVEFIGTLCGFIEELFRAHQRLDGFPRLTWGPPRRWRRSQPVLSIATLSGPADEARR